MMPAAAGMLFQVQSYVLYMSIQVNSQSIPLFTISSQNNAILLVLSPQNDCLEVPELTNTQKYIIQQSPRRNIQT